MRQDFFLSCLHLPFAGTNRIRFRGFNLSPLLLNSKFQKSNSKLDFDIRALGFITHQLREWAPHCVKYRCKGNKKFLTIQN